MEIKTLYSATHLSTYCLCLVMMNFLFRLAERRVSFSSVMQLLINCSDSSRFLCRATTIVKLNEFFKDTNISKLFVIVVVFEESFHQDRRIRR